MNLKQCSLFAPIVLRLAIAAVFVWFGVSQLVNSDAWVGLVPVWATGFGINAFFVVHFNGVFEILMGLFLSLGIFTRWVALILAAHLFVITTHLGLSAVGVRDFGLSFATLSIAMHGDDEWTLI